MTCTYDPKELLGAPIGMFHCPECGEMVLAGMDHPDYSLEFPEEPECPVCGKLESENCTCVERVLL